MNDKEINIKSNKLIEVLTLLENDFSVDDLIELDFERSEILAAWRTRKYLYTCWKNKEVKNGC